MPSSKPIDPLIEKATDWLLRLDEAPRDRQLRAAAETWRGEDPAHARAWKRAERAWRLLANGQPVEADVPPPALAPAGFRWLAAHRGMAAALLVAVALVSVLVPVLSGPRADFATATAELRQIILEDGSKVDLAPQTSLDVAYTPTGRSVTLLAGEAYFDVVPDAGRPFEVKAGGLAVKVLGTAFDVRMSAEQLSIGVAHGSVEARYLSPQGQPVRLSPGDRLVVARKSGLAQQSRVPPEEVASWRDRYLFVENAPLGEVVADLRRYSGKWIVIGDSHLAARQVTGLYDLRDPDRALRVLVGPFGGRVRDVTPFLTVLSSP